MEHDLIKDNPALKAPVLAVLTSFEGEEPRRRSEVEEMLAKTWDASWARGAAATIDILVRRKGLVEQVYVNGEPYAGTLEDVQTDEDVPEDAEAYETLAVTEKGRRLAAAYEPGVTMRALLEERPEYGDVFKAALWACADADGCSRADLEAQINEFPQLQPDAASGRTRVYPQFFIDALETAGGIEWRDAAWRVTEVGRQLL
ncbi:MAG: hypothetical protein KHY83_08945 [Coriobacteriia bacterium]|nr:hypothetical protein [Coriobacteriia bacterium]MBS5478772.1 hypothetical protein [Coriobacteriia bacterium]